MAEKVVTPKLTEAQCQALISTGFRTCATCTTTVLYQCYTHTGGPLNGPHWEALDPVLNPVTGSVHVCLAQKGEGS